MRPTLGFWHLCGSSVPFPLLLGVVPFGGNISTWWPFCGAKFWPQGPKRARTFPFLSRSLSHFLAELWPIGIFGLTWVPLPGSLISLFPLPIIFAFASLGCGLVRGHPGGSEGRLRRVFGGDLNIGQGNPLLTLRFAGPSGQRHSLGSYRVLRLITTSAFGPLAIKRRLGSVQVTWRRAWWWTLRLQASF